MVKATYILPFLVSCVAAAFVFLFCWAANIVIWGFVFLFLIPFTTAFILALDVPGWVKKWKGFQHVKGYIELIDLQQVVEGQPQDIFVSFQNQISVMVCEVKVGPWDYLTWGERQIAAGQFRAALEEANRSKVNVQVVLENYHETQDVPQSISESSEILEMIYERKKHWKEMERFQTYYHVVFSGKHKSTVRDAALDFVDHLEGKDVSFTFLARESILNWMAFQQDPFQEIEEADNPKQLQERLREQFVKGEPDRKKISLPGTSKSKDIHKANQVEGLQWRDSSERAKSPVSNRVWSLSKYLPEIKIPIIHIRPERNFTLPDKEQENWLFRQVHTHRLLAVWNTDGYKKADTALELAICFRKAGHEVAVLEFDTINPRLDILLNIPKPSLEKCYNRKPEEIGAGLLSFGEEVNPELAIDLLYKYKHDILYLPAGNTLGMTDARIMLTEEYKDLIQKVQQKAEIILIDCCADLAHPGTLAALRCSDVVISPEYEYGHYTNEALKHLMNAGLHVIQYSPEENKIMAM